MMNTNDFKELGQCHRFSFSRRMPEGGKGIMTIEQLITQGYDSLSLVFDITMLKKRDLDANEIVCILPGGF